MLGYLFYMLFFLLPSILDSFQLKEMEFTHEFSKQKVKKPRNFLCIARKCGRNCLRHAAQLQVLNGRKCNSTFHTFIITKIFGKIYLTIE